MSTTSSLPTTESPADNTNTDTPDRGLLGRAFAHRGVRISVLTLFLLSIIAIEPVAAAEKSTVCKNTGLTKFFNGLFKATTGFGLAGAVAMYKYQSLVGIISFNQETRKALKEKKHDIKKGIAGLVLSGPAYATFGSMMGLPVASCLSLGI